MGKAYSNITKIAEDGELRVRDDHQETCPGMVRFE
jgi:hypothetical protein